MSVHFAIASANVASFDPIAVNLKSLPWTGIIYQTETSLHRPNRFKPELLKWQTMSTINQNPAGEKRYFGTEIIIVLALSLGASSVYSILQWLSAITAKGGLGASVQALNSSASISREWLDVLYQLVNNVLGFTPVVLVVFLLAGRLGRGSLESIGWKKPTRTRDFATGLGLAAAIGIPGVALYFGFRAIGGAAQIIPSNILFHWWVVPILLLSALKAAALEEFIIVGYLFKRLDAIGWSKNSQILVSALLRGTYHLYQGYAGFLGNIAMGLVFGWLYKKYGRLQLLVIAHFILDAFTYIAYSVVVWTHIHV